MGYYDPILVLSIPTPDCKKGKSNVLILLTLIPSPALQPCMNINLIKYLKTYSSVVDLRHRNHEGSGGYGYLFFLACHWCIQISQDAPSA